MIVNILGTDYLISFFDYKDDPSFKKNNIGGYCDTLKKRIVVCNAITYPGWEEEHLDYCEHQQRLILRHEIVHAFLYESGLSVNTNNVDAWATNFKFVEDYYGIQINIKKEN